MYTFAYVFYPHLSLIINTFYAPTERLNGCTLPVIHQHRPAARTGTSMRIRTVLSDSPHPDKTPPSLHHLLYDNKLWRHKLSLTLFWLNLKDTVAYIGIAAIMHTRRHKVCFCFSTGPIFGQHKTATLCCTLHVSSLDANVHTAICIRSLSRACLPWALRCKETICSMKKPGMLAVTHSQGHTQPCCCMPAKQQTHREMNERDALPFLPLVLHPTLFSFPSRVHTVSEEGIHSWEERRGEERRRRRRRRRSKRG